MADYIPDGRNGVGDGHFLTFAAPGARENSAALMGAGGEIGTQARLQYWLSRKHPFATAPGPTRWLVEGLVDGAQGPARRKVCSETRRARPYCFLPDCTLLAIERLGFMSRKEDITIRLALAAVDPEWLPLRWRRGSDFAPRGGFHQMSSIGTHGKLALAPLLLETS